MEQKKVQRIVGILVIIAIVIVVMPLLFGKNNFPIQQAATIKAPPFPDQSQTITTEAKPADAPMPALASATNMDNAEANPVPPPTTPAQVPSTDQASNNTTLPAPPALSGDAHATLVSNNQPADKQTVVVTPEIAKKINEDSATTVALPGNENKPAGTIVYEPVSNAPAETPQPVVAAPVKPVEQPVPVIAKTKNTLPKPKLAQARVKSITHPHASIKQAKFSSGWAVQMGNFSVKQNAIRLANTLQAAGYKAFTKNITLQDGRTRTRVYIGPELKQASAVALSQKINQKLSMQGFVVSLDKA